MIKINYYTKCNYWIPACWIQEIFPFHKQIEILWFYALSLLYLYLISFLLLNSVIHYTSHLSIEEKKKKSYVNNLHTLTINVQLIIRVVVD